MPLLPFSPFSPHGSKMGPFFAISVLLLVTGVGGTTSSSFGINYGKVADNLPAPAEVVPLIQSLRVSKSKLYDADEVVLTTFRNSGISFIVGTANQDLQELSSEDTSKATAWVQRNVAQYLPATRIIGIVVGNEIFSAADTVAFIPLVLPAMNNVYRALQALGLDGQIFVSTAHSFSTLASSFPPSSGEFNPAIATPYMKPVLEFLSRTDAPFLINIYPFFAYKADPVTISLDYVLFQPGAAGVPDSAAGLVYTNMFDAQMDAVYAAIGRLGFDNITLLVSETGWPSAGDEDEHGASVQNAQTYHSKLVEHVSSQKGTPLRPNTPLDVYLFALFNENLKTGPTSERNYGLFRPDGSKVYTFEFVSQSSSSPSSLATPSLHLRLILVLLYLFLLWRH